MKIRSIVIYIIVIISLSGCKKNNSEEFYPNENIVQDNAQAALYFHTIFREAENAWATIHSKNYVSGSYTDPANTLTSYKKFDYDKETKTVSISYNAWVSDDLLLIGFISVKFGENTYRMKDQIADVLLTDFSINGQNVAGDFSIKYRVVENSANDHYTYSKRFDAAAIHEQGSSTVLISGAITNGQYERTEGGDTLLQDDDVWAYSGVMTGILRNDPNLQYTNTVLTTYTTVNGKVENGTIIYKFGLDCTTAFAGVAQIKITGYSDIIYGYDCTKNYFVSTTHIE